MFDVPSDPTIKEIVVNRDCVSDGKSPDIIRSHTA